jgi:DnaJ family protein C protein 1
MFKEAVDQIPRPRLTNLVPFQLVKLIIVSIINLPYFCTQLKQFAVDKWVEFRTPAEPEEPEPQPVVREKRKKRKKLFEFPEALTDDGCILDAVDEPPPIDGEEDDEDGEPTEQSEDVLPVRWGCKWTPEEYSNLAKSMKKIPGGVPQRWEKIAAMLERTVSEVTAAAKRLKESGYTLMNAQQKDTTTTDEESDNPSGEKPALQNGGTNDGTASENESSVISQEDGGGKKKQVAAPVKICSNNWNQVQQKALELALTQFPKGTIDRWDRIAKCVPSKTKDDCIQRYKYISELVKQKTQKQS